MTYLRLLHLARQARPAEGYTAADYATVVVRYRGRERASRLAAMRRADRRSEHWLERLAEGLTHREILARK